ncbi:MAG: hypothetical protein LBR33_06640 [Propionibacteriaceae bacterium]|jgi:hypothetical protein|nr:hypothetical protein [Propionibacteriaceae bacterium]
MRAGGRLPRDQAEIVLSDVFVDQLELLAPGDRLAVLAAVVGLCQNPGGKHALSARGHRALVGLNTLEILGGTQRVVFRVDVVGASITVLCLGPRRDSEVYSIAAGLVATGVLTSDEVTQLWDALGLLEVVAERVGLDGWDYRPPPAPEGLRRTAAAAGVVPLEVGALLSLDELQAALEAGWTETGPDPDAALRAALARARGGVAFDSAAVLAGRRADRCDAVLPRAQVRCIRRAGHPGPHRAR